MRVPEFRQLTALRGYLLQALHSDSILQAELQCSPQQIVTKVVPRRLFDRGEDSVMFYGTEAPLIGIFPTGMRREMVRGNPGMDVDLGIQYVLKAHVGDAGGGEYYDTDAKMNHILALVWWRISEHLQQPSDIVGSSKLIESLYPDTADILPQTEKGLVGLDGSLSMAFRRPPYGEGVRNIPLNEVDSEYEPYESHGDNLASAGVTDYMPGVTDVSD